jgi:hypothetical protein
LKQNEKLFEALKRLSDITHQVNESKRHFDRMIELFQLGQQVDDLPASVITSSREILCRINGVEVVSASKDSDKQQYFQLLLFNDSVAILKKRLKPLLKSKSKKEFKFISMHNLNDCTIKSAARDEGKGLLNFDAYMAQENNYKDLTLAVSSKEEMANWMAHFKGALHSLKLLEFKSETFHRKLPNGMDLCFHLYDYDEYMRMPTIYKKSISLFVTAGQWKPTLSCEYGAVGFIQPQEESVAIDSSQKF